MTPLDPLAARHRLTLLVNVSVMGLALLLGIFMIQQTVRRSRLESLAREDLRVRELERRLFHAERLSMVGRLAAGIAHELNNPLEGISNYLALAREDLERGDAASARRRLDGVAEGLHRAAGIVRQVLAHAEPSAAPMAPVDLHPILSDAVAFVRSRPEFARLEFRLDLAEGPLRTRGNAVTLGQLFLNLIVNACEAQPGGGEVRVTTSRDGAVPVVAILDRGPGVPASEAPRIFEPFYSTKSSTGLGLSICESIVRHHDGEMGVGDRPGGGAVFTLRFPPAPENPDA